MDPIVPIYCLIRYSEVCYVRIWSVMRFVTRGTCCSYYQICLETSFTSIMTNKYSDSNWDFWSVPNSGYCNKYVYSKCTIIIFQSLFARHIMFNEFLSKVWIGQSPRDVFRSYNRIMYVAKYIERVYYRHRECSIQVQYFSRSPATGLRYAYIL